MFASKVIVITGASGGIGRATAHAFAKEGAKVVLIARGIEGLEGAKKEVEALGGTALIIQAEVADAQQVEAAAERVENELGAIEVWVNNAMTSVFAPFEEIAADEFKRVTEVTYLGQVYGAMSALKRMQPRNRGSIVFVSRQQFSISKMLPYDKILKAIETQNK